MQHTRQSRVLSLRLAEQAEKFGDRAFLHCREEVHSYSGLYAMAGRMAAGLRDAGVGRGDMVGVMLPNCPEHVAVSFGISFLGGIEVPINIHHKGDILAYMIRTSKVAAMVVDAVLLDRLAGLDAVTNQLRSIIVRRAPGDGAGIPELEPAAVIELSDWSALGPLPPDPGVRPRDPFCLLYTSGTTGPSKGSVLPHNYAFHTVDVLTEHLEIGSDDVIYTFMPLFHNNAKLAALLPALVHGCDFILAERFSLSGFWADMRSWQVSLTNLIGGLIAGLLKQEPAPHDRDHSLRRVFTAGAGREAALAFEERFGIQVIEGYGMTETNMVLLNRVSNNRPGTLGRADCGFRVEIHDEEDAPVPPGAIGEIVVRPQHPHTMQVGYHAMPEFSLETVRNLWFHTGDLGRRDEAGDYYFIDRKKDSIRRLGENISSMELEGIVGRHPAILECAAFAVPSEYAEDEVMLVVVLKRDASLDPARLHDFCSENMARFMVPRYIEFTDRMPKNATGRIEKYKLRKAGVGKGTWDGKNRESVKP